MKQFKNVLNFGYIRLIDSMGNDLSIVRNARVSYNASWRTGNNEKSDKKLINYLMKNNHNTPFESVTVTFEVKAPIFVIRQWQRHRTQSYNELSARYKELKNEYYVPDTSEITYQSKDNKQMKTKKENKYSKYIQRKIIENNNKSFDIYNDLLSKGCPRELARSILPVGTYSTMFTTANLHNWFLFLKERLHEHAQYEIRVYAIEVYNYLKTIVPVSCEAFAKKYEI